MRRMCPTFTLHFHTQILGTHVQHTCMFRLHNDTKPSKPVATIDGTWWEKADQEVGGL